MPSSNLTLAPTIVNMIAAVQPTKVLDVGPGNGKYGVLVREYCPTVKTLIAVEAEQRYVDMFPWLKCIYDDIVVSDINQFSDWALNAFDLVLMIDVLEHMDHEVGEALLARIPGQVIICTPRDFFQNPEAHQGWETERHHSVWNASEIAAIRPLETDDVAAWNLGGILVKTGRLAEVADPSSQTSPH